MNRYYFSTVVDAPIEEVFAYHEKRSAIRRLLPPFEKVKVLHKEEGLGEGCFAHLQLKIGPFRKNWIAKHTACSRPHFFEDIQLSGPFKYYKHIHGFKKISDKQTEVTDEIFLQFPFEKLIKWFAKPFVEKKLKKLFCYRHQVLREDFKHKNKYPKKELKILVSGASGFVGRALCELLDLFGHKVYKLVRVKTNDPHEVLFNKSTIEKEKCEGFDAVIHLAGENVGSFWTKKKKEKIFASRALDTKRLVKALNELKYPPKHFLCASALGFYGIRSQKVLYEDSSKGEGFLSDVAKGWEASANLYTKGRVALLRFGMILGSSGGVLQKLLPLFKLGFGAIVGRKRDFLSWIALDDVIYQIIHVLCVETIKGPVNMVAPNPVTNEEFAKTLGKVLETPVLFAIPEKLIEGVFQEMGKSLFLSSLNAQPKVLKDHYAYFSYPLLKQFLQHELGKCK